MFSVIIFYWYSKHHSLKYKLSQRRQLELTVALQVTFVAGLTTVL